MTQLRQEGWIHHLARHAVACFLTRGDLWISWESGMKVFEELLLDADWSVNAGSWMWLSCSAFFQQFFHCYCPVGFGRRTDPTGDYIRRYIPILKDYPNRYIYEPWNAPESVQKAANCLQLSHYRGLSLLASVPTIQEEAEPPMTDESQTSSGPDSPPKPPDIDAAGCSTAPDSSTLDPSSFSAAVPYTALEDTSCPQSEPPTTISSTSTDPMTAQSKPSSPASPCPNIVPSPGRTTSLGPRRKSLARKARRGQRQRGDKTVPQQPKRKTEGQMRIPGTVLRQRTRWTRTWNRMMK
ncbi:hypothetical protein WMY93_023962 [Mugilogobius chulae]|uniref:Cryptochrome/DNA photolyase FAD-binding domain-containing protein n=1 Tax=Mugilogobius chulae TaxID=88201 RepID=A0AAW0NI43_9GOBI